jgi:hypothetical protein
MFPLGNLSQDAKIVPILSYASESSDRTSEVIDTKGYRNVLIVMHNAAINNSAAHAYELAHSDAVTNETTLSSGTDIEGTSLAIATDGDDKVQYYDGRPTKRYMQLRVNKDAAQVSAQSAIAYLYNGTGVRPVTQAAGSSTVGEGTGAVSGEATYTGWISGTL